MINGNDDLDDEGCTPVSSAWTICQPRRSQNSRSSFNCIVGSCVPLFVETRQYSATLRTVSISFCFINPSFFSRI